MNKTEKDKILEFLRQSTNIVPKFCDACGNSLDNNNVTIMGSKHSTVTCRIHCHNCNSTHLLNISMPINGVGIASRAPMNVDLNSAEEFHKFAGKTAVNAQDAIETYKSLDKMKTVEDFLDAFTRS